MIRGLTWSARLHIDEQYCARDVTAYHWHDTLIKLRDFAAEIPPEQ